MEKTYQACFRIPESKWKLVKHYGVQHDLGTQKLFTEILDVWLEVKKDDVDKAAS